MAPCACLVGNPPELPRILTFIQRSLTPLWSDRALCPDKRYCEYADDDDFVDIDMNEFR